MAIAKRSDWTAARDKAGIKSGAVSGAELGKALDAFHKEYGRIAGNAGMLTPQMRIDLVKPVSALSAVVKKYHIAIRKDKNYKDPAKKFLVDLEAGITSLVANISSRANPGASVSNRLKEIVSKIAEVAGTPTKAAYERFVQVHQRGLGADLKTLVEVEPKLKPAFQAWNAACDTTATDDLDFRPVTAIDDSATDAAKKQYVAAMKHNKAVVEAALVANRKAVADLIAALKTLHVWVP